MDQNQGAILLAVANPKQFLFAPFEMAIINIVLSIAFMILCIAVIGITPFWALLPMIGGHILLIGFGTRNPHLTTTLQATGRFPSGRRNIVKVSMGTKYVP